VLGQTPLLYNDVVGFFFPAGSSFTEYRNSVLKSRISATDIYHLFIAIAERRAILAVSLDLFLKKEYIYTITL